jgi:hypothetical protein
VDKILTLENAAIELQVTERYLSDKISEGKLIGRKVGKRIYVLYSDLIEFIKVVGKEPAAPTKDKK